jgi:uncharacterized protein
MRKRLQKILPDANTIKNYRCLKPFPHLLHAPSLWYLHRRSVAGGVAIGLFCGLIPAPLQMLGAALLAVWLRMNLPVALFTTLYTNPFTILPLYALAYQLGSWVSGTPAREVLSLPELHWHSWVAELWTWFEALGLPILIGLPLLAGLLAINGYILVRLVWRVRVVLRWRARAHKE